MCRHRKLLSCIFQSIASCLTEPISPAVHTGCVCLLHLHHTPYIFVLQGYFLPFYVCKVYITRHVHMLDLQTNRCCGTTLKEEWVNSICKWKLTSTSCFRINLAKLIHSAHTHWATERVVPKYKPTEPKSRRRSEPYFVIGSVELSESEVSSKSTAGRTVPNERLSFFQVA